jgi:Holliday junction resolvasome RuvABC endonuclease subunit
MQYFLSCVFFLHAYFENKMIAGLDLSINSPGLSIINTDGAIITSYFFPVLKRHIGVSSESKVQLLDKTYTYKISSFCHQQLKKLNTFQKFHLIQKYILSVLKSNQIKHIYIEGYAYDAKCSSATKIHELGGIMKYGLYENNITWSLLAPTSLKKQYTGSGRSDKFQMYKTFIDMGMPDLKHIFATQNCKGIPTPVQDIVDSFALAFINL